MKKAIVLTMGLALGACANTVSSDLGCPLEKGWGCQSVAEADERVLSEIGGSTSEPHISDIAAGVRASPPANATLAASRAWTGPARAPETVLRMLVAPFVDSNGFWHDTSVVYVPFGSAGWVQPNHDVAVTKD